MRGEGMMSASVYPARSFGRAVGDGDGRLTAGSIRVVVRAAERSRLVRARAGRRGACGAVALGVVLSRRALLALARAIVGAVPPGGALAARGRAVDAGELARGAARLAGTAGRRDVAPQVCGHAAPGSGVGLVVARRALLLARTALARGEVAWVGGDAARRTG
jgi:hypothetical protein